VRRAVSHRNSARRKWKLRLAICCLCMTHCAIPGSQTPALNKKTFELFQLELGETTKRGEFLDSSFRRMVRVLSMLATLESSFMLTWWYLDDHFNAYTRKSRPNNKYNSLDMLFGSMGYSLVGKGY